MTQINPNDAVFPYRDIPDTELIQMFMECELVIQDPVMGIDSNRIAYANDIGDELDVRGVENNDPRILAHPLYKLIAEEK